MTFDYDPLRDQSNRAITASLFGSPTPLASIINTASGVDKETLKLRMAEEYMTSADLQYIREQEEKAKQQITGDGGKTARRKLMRSWEEEKNTANTMTWTRS